MSRTEGRQSLYNHDNPLLGSLTSLKLAPKNRGQWGRPSIVQSVSSSFISRQHGRRDEADRADKNAGGKTGIDAVFGEIAEFNDDLMSNFVPNYTEFEDKLAASLDDFQTQIEKLQALNEQATRLHEQFRHQDSTTRVKLDDEIETLKRWETPTDKIDYMQDKVNRLRGILTTGKMRLAKIESELTEKEEEVKRARSQSHAVQSTIVLVTIFILILAYWLRRHWA